MHLDCQHYALPNFANDARNDYVLSIFEDICKRYCKCNLKVKSIFDYRNETELRL